MDVLIWVDVNTHMHVYAHAFMWRKVPELSFGISLGLSTNSIFRSFLVVHMVQYKSWVLNSIVHEIYRTMRPIFNIHFIKTKQMIDQV